MECPIICGMERRWVATSPDGNEERPTADHELEPWQWNDVVSIVNASLASQSAQQGIPTWAAQQSRLFTTYLENPQNSVETSQEIDRDPFYTPDWVRRDIRASNEVLANPFGRLHGRV